MPRPLPPPPRLGPARPERRPERGRRTPPPPTPDTEVALRLAIGRDGIGLELAQPVRVGPLVLTELAATLPGMRFPVDVSGGVPRFRHRRGELQRLEIEVAARALERWAAPRLRGLVGTRAPEVWVAARRAGATVCVAATSDPEEDATRDAPVLAFEVHALAEDEDLVLVVERARGSALPAPATALAIGCVEALLRGVAERQGAAFVVRRGAGMLARALLPEAGARAPAIDEVRWASFAAQGDTWVLHALHGALPAAPSEEALRAREVARLLQEGDDAAVLGEPAQARATYLEALERAPKHGEIVRRIVDVDARADGRAEAALALLVEARGRTDPFGTTAGELLARVQDVDAAIASLERTGETEAAPALAARAFEVAARLARDPQDAAAWLDRAIARAPRSTTARWARVERRLRLGRLEDALADVEHLEAAARSPRARHLVWLRAGRAWQAGGLGSGAGPLFERALRYAPDEPRALGGMGAALVASGPASRGRGVAVLERAVQIAQDRREPASALLLDLARALAEVLDELPTAIARVASIPADAPEAPLARGLEGRWRARLGDLAGATLAYARLRELAASLPSLAGDARAEAMAAALNEAAEMERDRKRDPLAAQRHLAAALRLRPRDATLLRAYRDVNALVAGPVEDAGPVPEADRFPEGEQGSATHRTAPTERPPLDLSLPAEGDDEDAAGAARVEELTRRLHANPRDDAAVDELLPLLEALGRGHELLALLSARLEDATPERRAELAPRGRDALERIAARSEDAGRAEEAALFRQALAALGLA